MVRVDGGLLTKRAVILYNRTMRKVEIIGPEAMKRSVDLEFGEYIIGRIESVEIPLDIRGISRNHARLDVGEDFVTITDLGSLNGTFVNEVEVRSKKLADGDIIRLGPVTIMYMDHASDAGELEAPLPEMPPEPEPLRSKPSIETKKQTGLLNSIIASFGGLSEFEIRLKIFSFHLALIFIALFFIFLFILPSYRHIAREEMLHTGKMLTHYLAAINRDPLVRGQTVLLDSASVRQEKGVKSASILDTSGKVIEPASMAGQGDAYSMRAAAADHFLVQEIGHEFVIFSVPMKDGLERVGTARVDFQFSSLLQLNQQTNVLLILGAIIFVIAAAVFSSLTVSTILKPVDRITAEVELCIKENLHGSISPVKNPVLNSLTSALNRLIIRAGSSVSAPTVSQAGPQSTRGEGIQPDILDALPIGLLIMNTEFKLTYINAAATGMLGLKAAEASSGKHLLELLKPGPRLSALMQGIKEMTQRQSPTWSWSESIDATSSGKPLNFILSSGIYAKGGIQLWIVMMTKRDEHGSA